MKGQMEKRRYGIMQVAESDIKVENVLPIERDAKEIKEKLDQIIKLLTPDTEPTPDCICGTTAGISRCPEHGYTGGFKGTGK